MCIAYIAEACLPIIAVRATRIPEIVYDRVNGLSANPEDTQTLSDTTAALLRNPKKARIIGKDGRLLTEGHDIHRTWSSYEKLYQELAGQARPDLFLAMIRVDGKL